MVITLSDLLGAGGGVLVAGDRAHFARPVIDSREAAGGDIFFALPGHGRDGHDFVADAARRGAVGAVVARPVGDLPDGFTVVRVPDTVAALQRLGAASRRRSTATVVAVTGSAGKTTTKNMITHVLGAAHPVLASAASFNNHLGVPLTLLAIDPEHDFVVAEIGTNGRGEIAALAGLVEPDVAVITNIGFAHIGNFAGRGDLAAEKTDLLRRGRPGGTWILNGDDDLLVATAGSIPRPPSVDEVRVGFGADNDIRAVDVVVDERGTRGTIVSGESAIPFAMDVSGRHFVRAALAAVAVARLGGASVRAAVDAVAGFAAPPGRASLVRLSPDLLVLDDSYNASPDATLAALDLLGSLGTKRRTAVLGEMRELGARTRSLHRIVGERVAEVATDLVTVGSACADLRAAAIENGLDPGHVWDADSAREAFAHTRKIVENTTGGGTVLIKGSRFTHMERVHLGLAGHTIGCGLEICSLYINCSTCPKLATGQAPTA